MCLKISIDALRAYRLDRQSSRGGSTSSAWLGMGPHGAHSTCRTPRAGERYHFPGICMELTSTQRRNDLSRPLPQPGDYVLPNEVKQMCNVTASGKLP